MNKKIFMSLTTAALALTVFTGCSSSSSAPSASVDEGAADEGVLNEDAAGGEVPVIQMVVGNGANTDSTPKVQEAVNEILREKVGAEVNITWLNWGSYSNQLNLMLSGDGEADIVMLSGFSVSSLADSGQLYPITEWYEEDPEAFTQFVDAVYIDCNRVDGELYTIPLNNNFSAEACMLVNAQMADELGFDLSDDEKIWSLSEIHDMAERAVEAYPGIYGVAPQSGGIFLNGYTYDALGDASYVGVVPDYGDAGTVVSLTECEDFLEFARTMHTWYEEGLIMQDVVSNTETVGSLVPTGKAFCGFNFGGHPNGAYDSTSCGYYVLSLMENVAFASSRMSYGIAGNSRNPELAFRVLKELYTNEEIENLLGWGIEGENYVVHEDGTAGNPEGMTAETNTYSVAQVNAWVLPNMQITYNVDSTVPGFYKLLKEYDNNARVSDAVGCIFSGIDVADEHGACANVMNEYLLSVMSGAIDVDEVLDDWKSELKDAGEDIVIAEKQRQLDEYLISK